MGGCHAQPLDAAVESKDLINVPLHHFGCEPVHEHAGRRV